MRRARCEDDENANQYTGTSADSDMMHDGSADCEKWLKVELKQTVANVNDMEQVSQETEYIRMFVDVLLLRPEESERR